MSGDGEYVLFHRHISLISVIIFLLEIIHQGGGARGGKVSVMDKADLRVLLGIEQELSKLCGFLDADEARDVALGLYERASNRKAAEKLLAALAPGVSIEDVRRALKVLGE